MKISVKIFIIISLLVFLLAIGFTIVSFKGYIPVGSRYFYWDGSRLQHSGLLTLEETKCLFDKDGSLYEGWYVNGSDKSYMVRGLPVTGEYEIEGKKYCFNSKGIMQTGIVTTDSACRYYSDEGVLTTGWIYLPEGTWYFDEDGMKTGWFKEGNSKYYFDKTGHMMTGWIRVDGRIYNFRENGQLRNDGWYDDESGTYYLTSDGHAVSGKTTIGGQTYLFSDSCKLLRNTWSGNNYAGDDGSMQTSCNVDGLNIDEHGDKVYNSSYGSGGSLFMPSISLQVPAWLTEGGEEGQEITDRFNSAAYLTSFNKPVIADHKNQGFEAIKGCIPESTVAFLLTPDSVCEYICTAVFNGSNVENDLLDPAGVSIDDREADLCLYTCNENWRHVTIVLFRKK